MDRARQICAAFALDQFEGFDRGPEYGPIKLTTMTHYDDQLDASIVFSPVRPESTLASIISSAGYRQLALCRNREICACDILL